MICEMLESGYDVLDIYQKLSGHDKIKDSAIYALVFSIKSGTRHKEIRSEYNIPKIVHSKKRPKFSKHDEALINKMILENKRTIEIVKMFGGLSCHDPIGKRITDKVRAQRKKLSIQ